MEPDETPFDPEVEVAEYVAFRNDLNDTEETDAERAVEYGNMTYGGFTYAYAPWTPYDSSAEPYAWFEDETPLHTQ